MTVPPLSRLTIEPTAQPTCPLRPKTGPFQRYYVLIPWHKQLVGYQKRSKNLIRINNIEKFMLPAFTQDTTPLVSLLDSNTHNVDVKCVTEKEKHGIKRKWKNTTFIPRNTNIGRRKLAHKMSHLPKIHRTNTTHWWHVGDLQSNQLPFTFFVCEVIWSKSLHTNYDTSCHRDSLEESELWRLVK